MFILALTLSLHIYSKTDNGGVIHFYGASTASAYQNIVNDNMLEPNCWDKFDKVVTRKVNMDSLIKQRQKLLAKYGKTRFLWVNKNRKQGMLEISYY